jgi:hypothetical protein
MLISRRAIRGMIKELGINTASRKPVGGLYTAQNFTKILRDDKRAWNINTASRKPVGGLYTVKSYTKILFLESILYWFYFLETFEMNKS